MRTDPARHRRALGAVALCLGALAFGAEVRCGEAGAHGPLRDLQEQIDELRAQVAASAPTLLVVDGNGDEIGRLVSWSVEQEGVAEVYLESLAVVASIERKTGLLSINNEVSFADIGCSGQPTFARATRTLSWPPMITSGSSHRGMVRRLSSSRWRASESTQPRDAGSRVAPATSCPRRR